MTENREVPSFYLPQRNQCVFVRYYTLQVESGKELPIWIYDKYVLPFIQ